MWKSGQHCPPALPLQLLVLSSLPFIRLFNAVLPALSEKGTSLEAADVSTTSGLGEVAVTRSGNLSFLLKSTARRTAPGLDAAYAAAALT